jgi:hypothetical protein
MAKSYLARSESSRRVQLELIRKRKNTLFKKADELQGLTNAEIFLLVAYNGQHFIYTTSKQPGWPPTQEQLVRCATLTSQVLIVAGRNVSNSGG